MVTDLCKEKIKDYNDNDDRYRLANRVLYKMVEEHPSHKDENEIVAKMWIIGRTYAAAIERRPNKSKTPGDFYYKYVAPKLKESEIDSKIEELAQYNSISESNLPQILSVHKYLMDIFRELTQKEKRSLASKYLHFHLPKLFFIYDSRVASVVTDFTGKKSRDLQIPEDADAVYAKFCFKAFQIYNSLNSTYSEEKTRVVDNILLRYCDEVGKTAIDEE